jgi:predicted aspartyl protease
VTRYNYNQDVAPPAPFVHAVILRDEDGAPAVEWPAQIDTGADTTVIPLAVVQALNLLPGGEVLAQGLGGTVTVLRSYLARVGLRGTKPVVIEVLAAEKEPYVLLGRDVLNHHKLVLDGPRLLVEYE